MSAKAKMLAPSWSARRITISDDFGCHGSLKPGFGIPPSAVIRVEGVHKYYELGETRVHALRGVSIEIHRDEFLAIIGGERQWQGATS
jgi:hypothetical protein